MYQPYQPPPRRAPVWPWVLATVVGLALIGMVATIGARSSNNTPPGTASTTTEAEAAETLMLEYTVEGTATGVTVRYSTWGDGTWTSSTERDITTPWSKTVEVTDGALSGGTLWVRTGAEGGEVTCSITVDGEVVKSAVASGAYSSAYCSGL